MVRPIELSRAYGQARLTWPSDEYPPRLRRGDCATCGAKQGLELLLLPGA